MKFRYKFYFILYSMISFGKIIPWYISFFKLHKPFIGLLILILQLQSFSLLVLLLFILLEFFTSANTDGFSIEWEW